MESAEQGGPGLVVEDNDDRGGRKVGVVERSALWRTDIFQATIKAYLVGGQDVELVDVEEPLGKDCLVGRQTDWETALSSSSLRKSLVILKMAHF